MPSRVVNLETGIPTSTRIIQGSSKGPGGPQRTCATPAVGRAPRRGRTITLLNLRKQLVLPGIADPASAALGEAILPACQELALPPAHRLLATPSHAEQPHRSSSLQTRPTRQAEASGRSVSLAVVPSCAPFEREPDFTTLPTFSKRDKLTHASQGIDSYAAQRLITKGRKGEIQAHHLIEARFRRVIGGNTNDWASIVVTRAEHQAFTNAWRRAIPYGTGTGSANRAMVENAAKSIYAKYPEILKALGL